MDALNQWKDVEGSHESVPANGGVLLKKLTSSSISQLQYCFSYYLCNIIKIPRKGRLRFLDTESDYELSGTFLK